MEGNTALIVAYAVIWLGLLAYLGWIAMRVHSVRADFETVRLLVEERSQTSDQGKDS